MSQTYHFFWNIYSYGALYFKYVCDFFYDNFNVSVIFCKIFVYFSLQLYYRKDITLTKTTHIAMSVYIFVEIYSTSMYYVYGIFWHKCIFTIYFSSFKPVLNNFVYKCEFRKQNLSIGCNLIPFMKRKIWQTHLFKRA